MPPLVMWRSHFFLQYTSNARSLNQAMRALLWVRRTIACAIEGVQMGEVDYFLSLSRSRISPSNSS